MQPEYPIDQLCQTLSVPRSGYHAWVGRQPGPRAQAHAVLWPLIEQAHRESRQTYGSPRVHRCQFATRTAARAAIFESIEVFYHRERRHSALGYKSPVDFETNLN